MKVPQPFLANNGSGKINYQGIKETSSAEESASSAAVVSSSKNAIEVVKAQTF
jgi:hypothetical protein